MRPRRCAVPEACTQICTNAAQGDRALHDDNWDNLRFVLAAARYGSTAIAAEALGVNESTVSRRLARAERAFGTILFHRDFGRLELTERAETMLDQLNAIDLSVDKIHSLLAGTDALMQGSVRITSAPLIVNHGIIPHLADYVAQHPGLVIELASSTAMLSVTHREADIAIRLERPSSDPDAIARKLGELTYSVYASAAARALHKPLPWVGFDDGAAVAPMSRWLGRTLVTSEDEPTRVAVSDNDTTLRCVLAGLGKSLLPDAIGRRNPELVRCPEYEPGLFREVWIMCHPSQQRLRRLRETAIWLSERIVDFLAPP